MGKLQLTQRLGANRSGRMAACTECREVRTAFAVENCLRHDRTRRIPSAKEQNIIVTHLSSLVAAFWSAASFRIRWLDRTDERTHELTVHLRGDGIHVDAFAR